MDKIDVVFVSHNRKPTCAPNPAYPNGIDVDLTDGAKVACLAHLPYPAECCGLLMVRCRTCGANAVITTAGRIDDPRTVKLKCKK
jgi:hypothetical protein